MKVLDATGRFIASPLGAVLFLPRAASPSGTAWCNTARAVERRVRGGTRHRAHTVAGRGTGALARDIAAPAGSGAARQSPDAPGAIAARRRSDAKSRKTTAGREGDLEEIHVTAESEDPRWRPMPRSVRGGGRDGRGRIDRGL